MRILLILLAAGAPALGCLNDEEVVRRDAEFRNAYGEDRHELHIDRPPVGTAGLLCAGIGLVLLGAAGAWLVLRRS